jgi:hypothetical protein
MFSLTIGVVDTCGKFANDDGGGKFAIGVNSRMPHNSMNAKKRKNISYCRDANIRRDTKIRRDTNIGGNTRSRRDDNNRRTRATAEKPIADTPPTYTERPGSEHMSTTAGPQQHHKLTTAYSGIIFKS